MPGLQWQPAPRCDFQLASRYQNRAHIMKSHSRQMSLGLRLINDLRIDLGLQAGQGHLDHRPD